MTVQKVFCVGFQKTGTTSLGVALRQLGYSVGGYNDFRHLAQSRELDRNQLEEEVIKTAGRYDAVKDTPYPVFYRELDRAYPNSNFILIIRDTDSWIRSVVSDFATDENSIHNIIYGSPCPVGHESDWVRRYEDHNNSVVEYFSGDPKRLLLLNLNKGEVGWKAICDFLQRPVPDKPWPHANSKGAKTMKMGYWKAMKRLGLQKS